MFFFFNILVIFYLAHKYYFIYYKLNYYSIKELLSQLRADVYRIRYYNIEFLGPMYSDVKIVNIVHLA